MPCHVPRTRAGDVARVTSHWSGNDRAGRTKFAFMLSALPFLASQFSNETLLRLSFTRLTSAVTGSAAKSAAS